MSGPHPFFHYSRALWAAHGDLTKAVFACPWDDTRDPTNAVTIRLSFRCPVCDKLLLEILGVALPDALIRVAWALVCARCRTRLIYERMKSSVSIFKHPGLRYNEHFGDHRCPCGQLVRIALAATPVGVPA